MKFLTTNFVKCAAKSCDASQQSFPLKYECELAQEEQAFNPEFIVHMLDRVDWSAVLSVASDLGNTSLPQNKPEGLDPTLEDDQLILRELHNLLIETRLMEGKMTCGNCGHIYYIKNSIPNFLLPPHLC